jgi:hypothetical protein
MACLNMINGPLWPTPLTIKGVNWFHDMWRRLDRAGGEMRDVVNTAAGLC